MAQTDLISNVVSSEAFKEVERLDKALSTLLDGFVSNIEKVNEFNRSVSGSSSLKQFADTTAKAKKETEELDKINKQISDTIKKRQLAESELGKQLAQQKALLQQTNKENANRAKILETEANSIARYEAVVVKLRAAQRQLNLETEEGRKKSEEYRKQIDALNLKIKSNSDAAKQQSLNVGNYASAAAGLSPIISELKQAYEKAANAQLKYTAELGANSTEAKKAAQTQEALQTILSNPAIAKFAENTGNLNAQYKALVRVGLEVKQSLGENSEEFKKIAKEIGEMKDNIEDAKAEFKRFSSDTQGFDNIASSVNFLASTFQTASGAVELFGLSNVNTEEAIRRMVAVENFANGIREIGNQLTDRGTIVGRAYATVQGLVATAMNSSATAAARLRAALLLTGIGALIAGIGLLIANYNKWFSSSKKVTDQQKTLNDINEKAIETAAQEITSLENLYKKTQNTNLSIKERKVAVDELQKQYPGYFGNINDEIILNGKAEQSYNNLKDAILQNAKVKAAQDLLTESLKTTLKFELQIDDIEAPIKEKLKKRQDDINKITKGKKGKFRLPTDAEFNAIPESQRKKYQEDAIKERQEANLRKLKIDEIYNNKEFKAAREQQERLKNFIANNSNEDIDLKNEVAEKAIKSAEDAAKKVEEKRKKIADEAEEKRKKEEEKRKEIQKDYADFLLKLSKENANAITSTEDKARQDNIEKLQKYVDDEKNLYENRVLANQLLVNKQIEDNNKLAENQTKDLKNAAYDEAKGILGVKKLSQKQIIEIDKNLSNKIIEIEKDKQIKQNAILENGKNTYNSILKQTSDITLANIAKAAQLELDEIDKAEQDKINALEVKFINRKLTTEQYEKEVSKIQADAEAQRTQSKLESAKELLSVLQKQGLDTTEAAKNLADIELQIEKDKNAKKIEETKKYNDERKQLEKQLGEQIKQTIISFVDSGFERRKNELADQLNNINKSKDAELERINSLTISEADKANKIKILEAQTQANREEIARRQKEIEIRQARFQKAVSVFDIGVNTGVGISKSIAQLGMPAAIPFITLISAIGALQIASVLAKPIPKYKHGLDYAAQDHLAITGDGGKSELIKYKDGSMALTPNKDTLTFVPKGAQVLSGEQTQQYLANMSATNKPIKYTTNSTNYDAFAFETSIGKLGSSINATLEKNKAEMHVKITNRGIDVLKGSRSGWVNYLNKSKRFN